MARGIAHDLGSSPLAQVVAAPKILSPMPNRKAVVSAHAIKQPLTPFSQGEITGQLFGRNAEGARELSKLCRRERHASLQDERRIIATFYET